MLRNFQMVSLTNEPLYKRSFSFLPSVSMFIDIVKVHRMGSKGVATLKSLRMRIRSRVSNIISSGLNSALFCSVILL